MARMLPCEGCGQPVKHWLRYHADCQPEPATAGPATPYRRGVRGGTFRSALPSAAALGQARRRAQARDVKVGPISYADVVACWDRQAGRCAWCRSDEWALCISWERLWRDGGRFDVPNLRLGCPTCVRTRTSVL